MFPGSFSCVDVVSAYSGDVGGLRLSCLFDGPVLGDASFAAGPAVGVASSFGVVVAGCRPEAFAVAAAVGGCGHGVHLTRWCWCWQAGAERRCGRRCCCYRSSTYRRAEISLYPAGNIGLTSHPVDDHRPGCLLRYVVVRSGPCWDVRRASSLPTSGTLRERKLPHVSVESSQRSFAATGAQYVIHPRMPR